MTRSASVRLSNRNLFSLKVLVVVVNKSKGSLITVHSLKECLGAKFRQYVGASGQLHDQCFLHLEKRIPLPFE